MNRKRLLRSIVAMVALTAMLFENTYSVMASVAVDNFIASDEDTLVVSTDDDVLTEEGVGQDRVLSEEEEALSDSNQSTDEVNISLSEENVLVSNDSSVNAYADRIEVTGRKDLTLYVNTDQMIASGSFKLDMEGASSLEYDSELAGTMKKADGGVYYIEGLNNRKFTARVTGLSAGLTVNYKVRSDGNPQVTLISADDTDVEKKLRVTDSGSEVKGSGYNELTVKFNGSDLPSNSVYNLYIRTDAAVKCDGESVSGELAATLNAESRSVRLSNLKNKAFTLYISGKSSDKIKAGYTIDSTDNGVVSAVLSRSNESVKIEHEEDEESDTEEEEVKNEKRVYEYRDADVFVTATLEDPEAIPDDAEFVVTRLTPGTEGYNYDAYMQALNDNADRITGDENAIISDDDVLLYDIAFYVTDKDGNRVELQPEEGTVTISIKFKKDQLKAELNAEDPSDITTVHLPLIDSVKEDVNTTAEATDISASDIKVEVVADNTSVENESVGFTLSDFSVAAVLVNGKLAPGSNETFKTMLGSASEYGIVANSVVFQGHFESNVAVGTASGNGPMAAPRNDGGNAGKAFIGEYTGGGLIIDNNGNKSDFVVYTTQDALDNMSSDMKQKRTGVIINTDTYDKDQIQSMVSGMITSVANKSRNVADNEPSYAFSKTAYKTNDKTVIDLKSKGSGAGTYFITFAKDEFATINKLSVILDSNQRVVFNIPDKDIEFKQYEVEIDGVKYTTNGNSSEDALCQRIIFNCPDAETVKTVSPCAGTFVVPNADFYNGSVSAGWVIANSISAIGGQEWHCVYHEMPPATGCSTSIEAVKTVDWKTPTGNQKFWFDLYSYDWNTKKTTIIQSVQNNGSKVTFDPFFYNQEGVYSYVLKERAGSTDTYIHDPAEYTIHVKVRLNSELNQYEIYEKNIYKSNTSTGSSQEFVGTDNSVIKFNNQTVPSVPFDFNITKLFYQNDGTKWSDKKLLFNLDDFLSYGYGQDWPDDATFTFDIERFDGGSTNSGIRTDGPMPEKKTITLTKSNRSSSFGQVFFTPDIDRSHYANWEVSNGVYTKIYMYKITERIPDDAHKVPGVYYTERPIYVKLFVESWWDKAQWCAKVQVKGRASYVNDNSQSGQECFPISQSNLEFVNAFYSGTLKVKKTAVDIYDNTADSDKDFYVVVYRKVGNDRIYYGTDGSENLYPRAEVVKGNSEITFDPLPLGYTYFVYESDKDGNQISNSKVYEVTYEGLSSQNSINLNDLCRRNKEVKIKNKQRPGSIKLIKKGEKGELLAGAEFALYKGNTRFGNKTYVTDSKGEVTVGNLPWGTYYFVETKAPVGYVLPQNPRTTSATIDETTVSETCEIIMTDDKVYGSLMLYKVDDEDNALAGATFKLYSSDETGDTKTPVKTSGADGEYKYDENGTYQELATNDKGVLSVTGIPYGSYRIYEEKAPAGYNSDFEPRRFNIDQNGYVVEITFVNSPVKANVEFIKVDDTDKPIKDVEFTLFKKANGKLSEVTKALSDSEGHVIFKNLGTGDYVITEEELEGYEDNRTQYTFTIKEEHNGKTITLSDTGHTIGELAAIINTPKKGKAELFKYVLRSGKQEPLSGAEFDLYKDGKKYNKEKLVTDEKGVISADELPWGSYYFIETKPPVGFNPDTTKIEFTISRTKLDFSGAARLEFENTPIKGYVELLKVDADDEDTTLDGVDFDLYKGIPSASEGKIGTFTTVNGMIDSATIGALEYGDYYFVEMATNDGYRLSSEPITFSIEEEGKVIKLKATNTRELGKVTLEKFNSNKSLRLGGAVFALYSTNPNGLVQRITEIFGQDYHHVSDYTTDDMGLITIDNLPWGNYYFIEEQAPRGYVADTSKKYRFTISGTQLEESLTYDRGVINDEEDGTIRLIKDDGEGDTLEGAEFELYKDDERYPNDQIKYTTDSKGEIIVGDLPWGTYYFIETKAPEGFVTPTGDDAKTDSVTINALNTVSQVTYNDIHMSNEKIYGDLYVRKVDSDKNELEGAKFSIVRVEGDREVNIALSGTEGVYAFDKFKTLISLRDVLDTNGASLTITGLPYGTYRLYEEKAPDGYKLVKSPYEFKIDTQGVRIDYDFENPLIQADLLFLKQDVGGDGVDDAVFTLYKVNPDGEDENLGTLTSNNNGKVEKKGLGTGDYYVVESQAPEGYEINKTVFTFKVTENDDKGVVTLSNADKYDDSNVGIVTEPRKTGSVKLWKVIKGTSTGLEGAVFDLYAKGNDTPIKTGLKSDEQGFVRASGLEWGMYYFKETEAPEGYVLDPNTKYEFEINAGNVSAEVTVDIHGNLLKVDNTPILGQARLVKKDSVTEHPIKGAIFALYSAKDNKTVDGYERLESDKNGEIITNKDLKAGSYYFKEVEPAVGYLNNPAKYGFTITQDNMDDVVDAGENGVALNTPKKGKVEIYKYTLADDGKSEIPLSGAEFTLYRKNKWLLGLFTTTETLESYVTNAEGTITVTDLEWGEYYFKETKAPQGYEPYDKTIDFTISATRLDYTGEYKRSVENKPYKGKVKLIKYYAIGGERKGTLEGAGFKFFRLEGSNPVEMPSSEEDGLYVTDQYGQIEIVDLKWGTYYFEEVYAPEGYAMPKNRKSDELVINSKTVEASIDKPITAEVTNDKIYGNVELLKIDDSEPYVTLKGAEFELYKEDGSRVYVTGADGEYIYSQTATDTVMVTTEDGIVKVDSLPYGSYYFKETKQPDKFILNKEHISFKIDTDQKKGEPALAKVTCINSTAYAGVAFIKADTSLEYPLDGVGFELWKKGAGADGSDLFISDVTSKNGGVVSYEGLTVGEYYFIEVSVPDDAYEIVTTPFTFKITTNDNGKTVGLDNVEDNTVINTPKKGAVELTKKYKINSDNEDVLQGAEFDLYREGSDTPLRSDITDEKGMISITGLDWGSYYFIETSAPSGYTFDKDQKYKFEINSKNVNSVQAVVAGNKRMPGQVSLEKLDSITKKPLDGVVFDLFKVDEKGSRKSVTTLTTENGKASAGGLLWGSYILTEKDPTIEGYVRNETEYKFVIDGDHLTKTFTGNEAILNKPIQGYFELKKEDAVTRKPIPEVQFDLYRVTEEGDKLVDSYWTRADGKLADSTGNDLIGPIDYGQYYLLETIPKGYKQEEGRYDFTIKTDGQRESFTNNKTVKNTPEEGSVVLRKVDEDKKPLAGAKFDLYAQKTDSLAENAAKILNNGYYKYSDKSYVTDEKGEIRVGNLDWDNYYFIETEAPQGYEIVEPGKRYEFTIDADHIKESIDVGPIINTKRLGRLELTKLDKETKEKLEGAHFKLYKIEDGEDIDVSALYGDNSGEFITTADGIVVADKVQWGSYYFLETKAPKDYEPISETNIVKSNILTVDATNANKETGIMQPQRDTVFNERGYGYVCLQKKFDGEQPKSLAGVEFSLWDVTRNKELGPFKTNEKGMIEAETIGRLAYGEYVFREVSLPVGISYSVSNLEIRFTIDKSNPIEEPLMYTFVNSEILASAKVIKIDPFTKEKIKGIKFGLYSEDGSHITDIYSDDEGMVVAEHLPMGKYYFKEYADSAAEKGYLASGDTFDFEITKDDFVPKGEPEKFVTVYKNGTRVEALEVPNPKLTGCIELKKLGKNSNGSLKQLNVADGSFELYKDDKLYLTAEETKASVSGNSIVIGDLPWGTYYFKEVKAPEGYVLPEGSAANTNTVTIDATTVSGSLKTPLICQMSDDTIRVYISKRVVSGAEELAGAQLELYEADAAGNRTGKALLAWTSTDTARLIEVGGDVKSGLIAGRTYVIHEVKAPDGYGLADDIVFSVNSDGSVKTSARVTGSGNGMTIIMEDARLHVSISKREMGTETELAGAQLRIRHNDEVVESWPTTGKPHVIAAELTAGEKYTLEEVNPPKGYYTAEPITFIVNKDGTLQITEDASSSAEVRKTESASGVSSMLIMYDRPIRVEISKKRLSGTSQDYVADADLALYEKEGEDYKQIFSWTSSGSGPVLIDYGILKVGSIYKVVETKVPAGYVKADDLFFTVMDYGEFEKTDANGLVTQTVNIFDEAVKAVFSKKASTGDAELAGAKLQVLDDIGNVVTEFISTGKKTLVTCVESAEKLSADERAAFAAYDVIYGIKLETGKSYRLHEVSSPSGYAMAEDVAFRIDDHGRQVPSPVIMRDKPLEIKLSKKDIGTGKYLAGASLELYNEADEKVAEWVSSDKPVLITTREVSADEAGSYAEVINKLLPAGKYRLHEAKAPEGYKTADDVIITVDGATVRHDNGDIREESMYDYKEGSTSLIGRKEWIAPKDSSGNVAADYRYPDITIELYRDSAKQGQMDATPYRSVTLENGATSFAFGNLEKYKTSAGQNYEYTYKAVEVMSEAASAKYQSRELESKKTEDGTTVVFVTGFENTLSQEYVDIKGVKTFVLLRDKDGRILKDVDYDDITIWLKQNGSRVDLDGDGADDNVRIAGGAKDTDGVAAFEFKKLPKYDLATGNEYKYTVEESGNDRYVYSIVNSENEIRITNIPKAAPFEIQGVKTWVDPDGAKRPDVTIQLFRDGKLFKETKLASNNTFSFTGLYEYNLGFGEDEGDSKATADGHKFFYEVKEAGALGYDVKISGSGDELEVKDGVAKVSITNTIKQEYIEIAGRKFWNDRGDSAKRPKVTVNLYASDSTGRKDELVDTYEILNTGSRYEFGTTGRKRLPKYDTRGKEISYHIEEKELKGYISTVSGNDIVNTPSKVLVSKLDATAHAELPGAVLSIVRKSDGVEVERWTSGTTPHYIEALELGEVYTLIEISAPLGYAVANPVDFQVGTNGIEQKVEMFDDPVIGAVVLTKLDATNREKLAGAEFNLYSSDGKIIYATGINGSYTYSKTSTGTTTLAVNSSGELKVDKMPYGTYYFKEVKAPKGYELKNETISFSITDSEQVVNISYENPRILGAVILTKTDATEANALAGAEFELYSKTPSTTGQAAASTVFSDAYYRYGTYTTDSEGRIKVEDLPWDDYYFLESKAPDGYETNRDVSGDPLVYTFTVGAETAGSVAISLGMITNEELPTGVLGERIPPAEKVSGVLGVRSKPSSGVLGARVGPATGDVSAIALWLTILIACVGTIVWLLVSRKKGLEK